MVNKEDYQSLDQKTKDLIKYKSYWDSLKKYSLMIKDNETIFTISFIEEEFNKMYGE